MENNKQKILLLHGFKRYNVDDFGFFKKYIEEKHNIELIYFNLYDNHDKKTINWKKFKTKIIDKFEEYKNEPIAVLGYSLGGLAGISLTSEYDNIRDIYAVCPPIKVHYFEWIGKLWSNRKKSKQIKKKLGKEKYKKLKARYNQSKMVEKHPIKIVHQINKYRVKIRRKIKKLNNKNIKILFSTKDEVVYLSRTEKYLTKNLDITKNKIHIEKREFDHFNVFNYNNKELFKDILEFLNI